MKHVLSLCLVAFLVLATFSAPASAMDLVQAKTQGLIGEQPDGLVGIVTPPGSADIQALVRSVNDGRMASYRDIAAKQGASVGGVQNLAGRTLVEKTPPGQFVLSPSGQWIRK